MRHAYCSHWIFSGFFIANVAMRKQCAGYSQYSRPDLKIFLRDTRYIRHKSVQDALFIVQTKLKSNSAKIIIINNKLIINYYL